MKQVLLVGRITSDFARVEDEGRRVGIGWQRSEQRDGCRLDAAISRIREQGARR